MLLVLLVAGVHFASPLLLSTHTHNLHTRKTIPTSPAQVITRLRGIDVAAARRGRAHFLRSSADNGGGGADRAGLCPVKATRKWVEQIVVGLNLCPWARAALDDNLVNIKASKAENVDDLVEEIKNELVRLASPACKETSIIVTETLLEDFDDYMDAVDRVESAIEELDLDGVLQLASFHPSYQFAGTKMTDAENWTNRSPFPSFHILKEDEVEKALQGYSQPEQVYERNIRLMKEKGFASMAALLRSVMQQ
jgi:hypothetical protein